MRVMNSNVTKSFQDENTLIEHACFPKDNSFLNEYLVSKSTNNNKNALQNQSFTYFFTKIVTSKILTVNAKNEEKFISLKFYSSNKFGLKILF